MRNEKDIMEIINHPFLVSVINKICIINFSFNTPSRVTKSFICLWILRQEVFEIYIIVGELFLHLRKSYKFTEDRARFYVAEILLALEYLHSQGIIYRDLKPENILLDRDGHLALTDFGLSKAGMFKDELSYTLCGTPEYVAPEILQCKNNTT